jgi:phage antirepressor YoqD-like protein
MSALQKAVPTPQLSNPIIVCGVPLVPVEYYGARVMTLGMMDTVHQRPDGTARRNFNESKARLINGEDFHKVSANEIRTHKICAISNKAHEDMILLTESGYSMLVKSFTDDLAWEVQRQLVRAYFRSPAQMIAAPDFGDPIAMARAWADAKQAEREEAARADFESAQREQLEHQVAELTPAAAGLELIAGADGTMCITDAAKTLQMQPYKLRDALLEMKWMYRRQGKAGYVAYQPTIHSGYLVHKVAKYENPETGEKKSNAQVLVTRKGLAKLAKLLSVSPPPSSQPRQLN